MIEAEVMFVVLHDAQNLYYRKIVEEVAQSFSLSMGLKRLRPVRVLDRYFDTPDFQLLQKGMSLRVRERRFTDEAQSEGRFTLKTPHPDQAKVELAVIRNEYKLNLREWNFGKISEFLGAMGAVLGNAPLESKLAVEELSEEAELGEVENSLNISFDRCHFINEATYELESENIVEIESHGLPIPVLEDIGRWLIERYPFEPTRESKYQRGCRVLKIH